LSSSGIHRTSKNKLSVIRLDAARRQRLQQIAHIFVQSADQAILDSIHGVFDDKYDGESGVSEFNGGREEIFLSE
jgi:hypothetical protein